MNSGYVTIIGRPNVGKSTMLNKYLGEKVAAVSPKPQTTRNRIMGIHTTNEGQIIFMDTPGVHKPFNKMHKKMVELTLASIKGIDLILLIADASKEFGKGDEFVLEQLKDADAPIILGLNKMDLIKKEELLPLIERYDELMDFKAIVPISAIKGQGLDRLEKEIISTLPENEPFYPKDMLSDQTEAFLAAEIIREKVFLYTKKEIPFCTAVVIDAFDEEEDNRLSIAASILVDKGSQKGIIIGKQGQMLKKIGSQARQELEKILATRIFLDIHVKVKGGWREDDWVLQELGL